MRGALLCLCISLAAAAGCGGSGPLSTDTASDKFGTLPKKIAFLERYVTFRRSYEKLDYHITYQNNSGGMVPAPSDWDIRIVAQVPAAELPAWTAGLKPIAPIAPDRLKTVPTPINASGVSEWYQSGHVTVGVDRTNRIIVYRNLAL